MKNFKLFLSFIGCLTIALSYSQCPDPVIFTNDLCVTNGTPAQDICLKNDLGDLRIMYNGMSKYSLLKNSKLGVGYEVPKADVHLKSTLGFGETNDALDTSFRIEHDAKPLGNKSLTYFIHMKEGNMTLFERYYGSGMHPIFGIDAVPQGGNLVYLSDQAGATAVQLSGHGNTPSYFMGGNSVGIGTTTPIELLDVAGNINISGNNPGRLKFSGIGDSVIQKSNNGSALVVNSGGGTSAVYLNYASTYGAGSGGISIFDGGNGNNVKMRVTHGTGSTPNDATAGNLIITPSGGKVVIGDPSNAVVNSSVGGYKLLVQDGIMTEKLKVVAVGVWADHVFSKDYPLKSLYEVKDYIDANRHLPNIPSAETIIKDGLDVGDMQVKQMEKIEELTLYMIEMKKEIDALKKENQELRKSIDEK